MGIQKTVDGRPRLAIEKSDAPKKNFFSHDWTDKTSWYTNAGRVVDEVAADTGDHLTYMLAHAHVIDLSHGKVFAEDYILDAGGHRYVVDAKVNGVSVSEQDAHEAAGGDFTVDYDAGSLTFIHARDANDIVTVTYHYATDSAFYVRPDPGKALLVQFAEVQFSADVEIRDTVEFQPYGFVDAFAPHLMPGVPSGTKLPLGNPIRYKSMRDYQTEAVKAYPSYPAMGGTSWRGMSQPVLVMDWDYISSTQLRSDAGMEIRLKLAHDTAFGGAYATCAFYCSSESL
jgi:hypothetical protein